MTLRCCQRRACRHASCSTQAPIGTIRPVSSASGMNSVGPDADRARGAPSARAPRRRRCAPVASDTSGWKKTRSSLVLDRAAESRSRCAGGRARAGAHDLVEQHQPRRRRPPWRGTSRRRRRGSGRSTSTSRSAASAMPRLAVTRPHRRAGRWNGVLEGAQDRARPTAIASCSSTDVLAQDRELVAAEPRDGLAPAQRVAQPVGDRHDQLVSGRVAEAVVDRP